jgi:CRP-like cAMP-binding protein
MFFIVEGAVDILTPESTGINHSIEKGNFVGELALLNKVKRTCSVMAKTFWLLYVLQKEDFDRILEMDADFAASIYETSVQRKNFDTEGAGFNVSGDQFLKKRQMSKRMTKSGMTLGLD